MNDFFATLKQKAGPFPVGVWAALGTIALALVLIRRKSKNSGQTDAAANQTNSNLSSAAELANMFEVAGLMPYQGGDVYVNTTTTEKPPPSKTHPSPLPAPVDHKPPVTGGGGTRPKPNTGKGKYVTVAKWTPKNAPWNSTVWGITSHLLGPKTSWKTVWNAPQNSALRAKRKDPKKIQAGDKIWVPGAK